MDDAIVVSPTNAASQEAVVGSAQRVVGERARAPCDAAVKYCLEYIGPKHLEFELEGRTRSVVQFEGLLPEAAPCVAYAPVNLDGQVGVVVDTPPEVYELVRLFVHLARCLYAEYDNPFVRKCMISVLASDTVRPNAAHTITITPPSSSASRAIASRLQHYQRKACTKAASPGLALRQLLPPAALPSFSSSGAPMRP